MRPRVTTYIRKRPGRINSVIGLGNDTLVASCGGLHMGQGQALCMQDCDFHRHSAFHFSCRRASLCTKLSSACLLCGAFCFERSILGIGCAGRRVLSLDGLVDIGERTSEFLYLQLFLLISDRASIDRYFVEPVCFFQFLQRW